MKKSYLQATAGYAAIVFAVLFVNTANAKCSLKVGELKQVTPALMSLVLKPQAHQIPGPDATRQATTTASIAGLWYARFLAGGQLVDDGFDVWNSDGTEILNDSPAPSSGAVCVGVWTKTSALTYTLKHPSWIFDDAGVNLIGVVIIREYITLDPAGNSYSGDAVLDVYDLAGNLLGQEFAEITGERIVATDDPTQMTGIPGLPPSILKR
jgi:hypothetical protein